MQLDPELFQAMVGTRPMAPVDLVIVRRCTGAQRGDDQHATLHATRHATQHPTQHATQRGAPRARATRHAAVHGDTRGSVA